jgi:site-specific recombinase XerD
MIEAGLPDAPQCSPKGLRHGFGINATVNGIPLHRVQKWMGHAQLSTTAIYADSIGKEEQDIAAKSGVAPRLEHWSVSAGRNLPKTAG